MVPKDDDLVRIRTIDYANNIPNIGNGVLHNIIYGDNRTGSRTAGVSNTRETTGPIDGANVSWRKAVAVERLKEGPGVRVRER